MRVPASNSQSSTPRRALFLDRDGIINIDKNYVHTREQFELVESIGDVLRHFETQGYLLIIVTNQAGIARGYYTEEEFLAFDAWMRAYLHEQFGVTIAKTYYAPHHPDGVVRLYRADSPDRKPNPGMLLAAQRDFELSLPESVLLGDKESDIEAGYRAGVGKKILYTTAASTTTRADLVIAAFSQLVGADCTVGAPLVQLLGNHCSNA